MAGLTLRDRVKTSVIWEELRVELLLLCMERSQLELLDYRIRMPTGWLLLEVY